MSKTIKNCFDDKLTYINLYNAYYRICKNRRNKSYILKFELDLETNLINIMNELKTNTYKPGKYHEFIIYEPKQRLIKALPFKDRVVHQWYIGEFIKPFIVKRFITDTYSCIENRGTHKAVLQIQKYMQKYRRINPDYYVLKCDIKKYFYSINKDILFNIMSKYITDKKLLNLTKIIIFDDDKDRVGIPIGNYTSQYFANIYLNELDHYVKDVLKVKYYVRYMDDFVLLLDSKSECKIIKRKIEEFIEDKLKLTLNSKSKYFPNSLGVDFCGYRIFNTHRLLRKSSRKKILKKIKKWNKKYFNNEKLDYKKIEASINSWLSHSNHCNSYKLQQSVLKKIAFDYKNIISS